MIIKAVLKFMIFISAFNNARAMQYLSREGEFSYGNFLETSEGKILQKIASLLSNSTTPSKDECWTKCIENKQCLSINLITLNQSQYQCELLNWSGSGFGKYLVPRNNSWYMQLQVSKSSFFFT